MKVMVNLELKDDEKEQLADILLCSEDDLGEKLESYAKAALEEYVRMFLGQKVFTRGPDIREYRLFLLIKHAFENKIPDEQRICDLFQTTVPQTRSLIRSVLSKFQYELTTAIQTSLRTIIKNGVKSNDENGYTLTIHNQSMVDALNRLLAFLDGTLPPIYKKKATVSTYVLKPSSRKHLLEYLDNNMVLRKSDD